MSVPPSPSETSPAAPADEALPADVRRRATAWELIGWDDGPLRIRGGRAVYEAVLYNCLNNASNVKLARLEAVAALPGESHARVREVSRYVTPDTVLEVLIPPPRAV